MYLLAAAGTPLVIDGFLVTASASVLGFRAAFRAKLCSLSKASLFKPCASQGAALRMHRH